MSSVQSFQTETQQSARMCQVEEAASMPRGQKDPLWTFVGIRLCTVRMNAKISSTEVAARAGVAYSMVLEIENTARVPRVDSAEKIACALGVCPSWLCFGPDGNEPFRERIRRPVGFIQKSPRAVPGGIPCGEAYRDLPKRLKAAREALGLSLRAVARESQLSAQSLSTTELGTTIPTVENIEAIAKALGVSPGWLAFGIGRGPDGRKHRAQPVA